VSKRTATPETSSELETLNQIRLDADLTYVELAEAIGIDASALFRILNHPTRKPHDRTLHKIRRFLEQHAANKPAPRAARRAAAR
jgi:hypothetical protein